VFIELLAEYGLFFAKVATFLIAIVLLVSVVANAGSRGGEGEGRLEVKKLNDRYKQMEEIMQHAVLDEHVIKLRDKAEKQEQKKKDKAAKKEAKKLAKVEAKKTDTESNSSSNSDEAVTEAVKGNVYVLDFDGDMKASEVENFREEITTVLTLATPEDEVVVRLESPGGMVHSYGLASSQLARIRSANVPLTICVDKVAASGGYMMACIADKILAAPFAVIGSIGVVASLPNFNKVLKKLDVDYDVLTAGEYKRTLTMLGENTEEGRKKFIDDLEETHELFKSFVGEFRPKLDIPLVATGETWYGKVALEKLLVDGISTSDEYISQRVKETSVFEVKYVQKKSWQEKLGVSAQAAVEKSLDKVISKSLHSWTTRH
jgi:serine protease SohB